mmetsp:Transcript_102268/g.318552  ORF Transcript_102268/g.318552 Transcript_102268/m.318552 type:complete len:184 (+) Transcript_102268:3-554(+)
MGFPREGFWQDGPGGQGVQGCCLRGAVGAKRVIIVTLLMEKTTDALVGGSRGGNAMHDAAAYHRKEACNMAKLKDEKGNFDAGSGKSDLEVKKSMGVTCSGFAVSANCITDVNLLLEKKTDALAGDSSGGNEVHYATTHGREELLECFIKKWCDEAGESPRYVKEPSMDCEACACAAHGAGIS